MKWETTILAAVQRCPGLTARGLANETGATMPTVYQALRALECSGIVKRTDDWPAGWVPVEGDAQPGPSAPDPSLGNAIDAIGDLLSVAMRMSEWQQTPHAIKRQVEHAWVEVQRVRGGDGVY